MKYYIFIYALIGYELMFACPFEKLSENLPPPTSSVEGYSFSRKVKTDGSFGQPVGEREHEVSFKDGVMLETAPTFFGNPPEYLPYKVSGNIVFVKRDGKWIKSYKVENGNLLSFGNVMLSVKKAGSGILSLENKSFVRKVKTDGYFGQPVGEREHEVSFKDGVMMETAPTFFGNPPEYLPYKISGDVIFKKRDGEWIEAYKVINGNLVNSAGAVLTSGE